jgi:hypothetical protein
MERIGPAAPEQKHDTDAASAYRSAYPLPPPIIGEKES